MCLNVRITGEGLSIINSSRPAVSEEFGLNSVTIAIKIEVVLRVTVFRSFSTHVQLQTAKYSWQGSAQSVATI